MPPRHVYWTIIYGNQATSFRAATPEELLPTLKQLQSRHPDAVLKYFARGKLWNSPEEARPRDEGRRRDGRWRPGRREDRPREDRPREDRPREDRPREFRPRQDRPRFDRPPGFRPHDDTRRTEKPREDGPREERRRSDRPREERWARPPAEPREPRPDRERRSDTDKPAADRRGKNWRPGGEHRDPRDRWKVPRDVKRKRFAQRLRRPKKPRE